jgi:hypothetical protein
MNFLIPLFFGMQDSMFDWIFSHVPIIATIITIIMVLILTTFRVASWITDYGSRFRQVEQDVCTLKKNMVVVNKRLRKFKVVDAKLDALDKKFDLLDKKYDKLDKKFDMLLSQFAFNKQGENK